MNGVVRDVRKYAKRSWQVGHEFIGQGRVTTVNEKGGWYSRKQLNPDMNTLIFHLIIEVLGGQNGMGKPLALYLRRLLHRL